MAYAISDECISCGACAAECPVEAISVVSYTHLDVYKRQFKDRPAVFKINNAVFLHNRFILFVYF